MPNIVSTVTVVQASDVAFKVANLTHPALIGKLFYRVLGGVLEVHCQAKLNSAVTSGAMLGTVPVTLGVSAMGLLYRYTSDADTSPDIRRCTINTTGVITNTSGLAFNIGYTLMFDMTIPIGST